MRSVRARRLGRIALALAVWLLGAVGAAAWLFAHSSAPVAIAGHDTVVHPTFDGDVRLETGPWLPDLRRSGEGSVGVRVVVGKTTAASTSELVTRYAGIAAAPRTAEAQVRGAVRDLAFGAIVRGGLLGLLPIGIWLLVGRARRAELSRLGPPLAGAVAVGALGAWALVLAPWRPDPPAAAAASWQPLGQAIPDLAVPERFAAWEVRRGPITAGTRRLVESAFATYERSVTFYDDVLARVPSIAGSLREPAAGEQVAVLVSDRHDNVGMDQVARAIADAAGAEGVLDAGDDTGAGEGWEAFSLDSLHNAFEEYDARVAVAGNHDHGGFVSDYLADLGWTHLDGEPVTPFAGVRMLGVDDPRSSGLGTWRDESDLTFAEVESRIARTACALDEDDERVGLLLVHDANLGREALAGGCVDLVLGGHLHRQVGPDRVLGSNGRVGYGYTNGTTGGAAYAVSVGQRLRVDAQVTLVTFADRRPAGLQPVTIRPSGAIEAAAYVPLELD